MLILMIKFKMFQKNINKIELYLEKFQANIRSFEKILKIFENYEKTYLTVNKFEKYIEMLQ